MGWNFPNPPTHLFDAQVKMKELLHGAAPTLRYEEDNFKWDPLGIVHTIKAGYDALLMTFSLLLSRSYGRRFGNLRACQRSKYLFGPYSKGRS